MEIARLKSAAAICAVALSFIMYVAAFEPFGAAELAYVFAVPAILACRYLCGIETDAAASSETLIRIKNGRRIWLVSSFVFSYVSWVAMLTWLRHVWPPSGYAAMFLLPVAVAGLFIFPWFALLPHLLPKICDSASLRLLKIGGLAGLWILLEWLRAHMFSGFPWSLLGDSQWLRPTVIQTAEYGGVWLVSFILIFFNLAAAEYIFRLFEWQKFRIENRFARRAPFTRLCPEFYLALLLALIGMWIYVAKLPNPSSARFAFRAGLAQTDFAGILKWDDSLARNNLETVKRLAYGLKTAGADVALFPEAATPPRWPIVGTPEMRNWFESLCKDFGKPILTGNMAYYFEEKKSQNIAVYISPESGLSEKFYAKTKLVPFGEYVPAWASFIGKVVPVGDMKAGDAPTLLDAEINGVKYKIGTMICYEDIFPSLGRERVAKGADMLFVCTNDSWYGREGGAWQHAAHSALQAVSTRRPLLRSSNNGLSAVFDQYGRMNPVSTLRDSGGNTWRADANSPAKHLELRDERGNRLDPQTLRPLGHSPMTDENGSIYFRGAGVADVIFFKNFDGVKTFYVRYGDWIVGMGAILFACALLFTRKDKIKKKLERRI